MCMSASVLSAMQTRTLSFSFVPSSNVLFLPVFLFNDPATTDIYTLSLHDALPISRKASSYTALRLGNTRLRTIFLTHRSEEHTSELQSRGHLVCRLLLEKKKKYKQNE